MLLLPWPLRVRSSDFRAVPGSVQRLSKEPFGFFEFVPEERLDLDLVDRVLLAALDEVESIDVVVFPEEALEESEIVPLEALLNQHGVTYLQAGVRGRAPNPGGLGSNWVHIGVNPRLKKVERLSAHPAASGFTFGKTSTIDGRLMRHRSINTTLEALYILTSNGGRQWISPDG